MDYTYQLVYFCDVAPGLGELVYHRSNGWLPHVVLRRRFRFTKQLEQAGMQDIEVKLRELRQFNMIFGSCYQPAHRPVKVVGLVDDSKDDPSLEDSVVYRKFELSPQVC